MLCSCTHSICFSLLLFSLRRCSYSWKADPICRETTDETAYIMTDRFWHRDTEGRSINQLTASSGEVLFSLWVEALAEKWGFSFKAASLSLLLCVLRALLPGLLGPYGSENFSAGTNHRETPCSHRKTATPSGSNCVRAVNTLNTSKRITDTTRT